MQKKGIRVVLMFEEDLTLSNGLCIVVASHVFDGSQGIFMANWLPLGHKKVND